MEEILSNLEDTVLQREVKPGVVVNLEEPNEYGGWSQLLLELVSHRGDLSLLTNADSEAVKAQAVAKVQSAVERQKNKVSIP